MIGRPVIRIGTLEGRILQKIPEADCVRTISKLFQLGEEVGVLSQNLVGPLGTALEQRFLDGFCSVRTRILLPHDEPMAGVAFDDCVIPSENTRASGINTMTSQLPSWPSAAPGPDRTPPTYRIRGEGCGSAIGPEIKTGASG